MSSSSEASSSALLAQLGNWLYNINPTLCNTPPRPDDDGEYCFCDDTNPNDSILCKDINYGHSTCVGSWMLSPEHLIVEGIIVTIISVGILYYWVLPKLHSMTPNLDTINITHPSWSKPVSIICLGMVLIYKVMGYPGRIYYVVMPCNMQWILSFIQSMLPNNTGDDKYKWIQYTLLQIRLTYIMSVIIAIVTPETDDCEHFIEYEFYWINHILLLILPACYILNGSVSTIPSTSSSNEVSTLTFNFYWWLYSCCIFSIFYFIPVTLMAIVSGLNLNFMLHPPNDHFILYGKYFRLTAIAL